MFRLPYRLAPPSVWLLAQAYCSFLRGLSYRSCHSLGSSPEAAGQLLLIHAEHRGGAGLAQHVRCEESGRLHGAG